MKIILRVPYTLSVCAVAAILASCGGSAQLPNPNAQTLLGGVGVHRISSLSLAAPQRLRPTSSDNEVLIGKAKLIKPCHTIRGPHGKRQGSITNFSAYGDATGPYPGTFTATGSWTISCNRIFQCFWTFGETFTITSGSSTISGTAFTPGFGSLSCTVVKNLTVPYTSGSESGDALVNIIQKHDFSETLDGL